MTTATAESSQLGALVARLRAGDVGGVELLKQSPVRRVFRAGGAFVKLFERRPGRALREARNLERARRAGLRVPEVLAAGDGWLATRWMDARPARRDDLAAILTAAERMHAAGLLHRDFHLGNLLVDSGGIVVTDWQGARRLPFVPRWLRRRELGVLAYSLGEPLPAELTGVRFWCALRAQRHWRSRTRRCLLESGGFTAFEFAGERGFRRREADPGELTAGLAGLAASAPFKDAAGARLYRSGRFIIKQHASARAARRAWRAGHGLEVRGIATGRALACAGRWLLMEDAGPTLIDWVEQRFAAAPAGERDEMASRISELVAALHRRGIYHPDLKANNVAWRPGQSPRLLDYGRVRFGLHIATRRRIKNLAQLNAALPDLVPSSLREQGLRLYLRDSRFAGASARLRERVIVESLRRRHRWSGC